MRKPGPGRKKLPEKDRKVKVQLYLHPSEVEIVKSCADALQDEVKKKQIVEILED